MKRLSPWLLGAWLASSAAFAQATDGGPLASKALDGGTAGAVAPKAVNPGGADEPSELIRSSGIPEMLPGEGAPTKQDPHPRELTPPPAPEKPAAEAPVPEVSAHPQAPATPASPDLELTAALAASFRASGQGSTAFPLDATGLPGAVDPLMTRIRVTPEIHMKNLALIAEADAATGAALGVPSSTVVGTRVTYPALQALDLRKAYLEYKWATGAFRAGLQTSDWGLGLLANNGAKDPEAGDFGQKQFGTLAYRALIAARPFFGAGGAARAVETAVAVDMVVRDASAEFARGDRALQGVLALRFKKDDEHHAGLYVVYRSQTNVDVVDGGKKTDVWVIDAAGQWEFLRRGRRSAKVGFEALGITGTTTQARNLNADVLQVRQAGAALKSSYRFGLTTVYFDAGWASGDSNPSDGSINNYRFDRDYKVGLILFDQVLAYQSARGSVRAADPSVVGRPPEGVDQLGTGGSVTGAWYLYPRVKISLADWLDGYGGPLFAFSSAPLSDPFETQVGGGTPRNALGGKPGSYLGTELDVGAQARFKPVSELVVTATGEGGVFFPGSAFAFPSGAHMGPIFMGRIRLGVAL